MHRDRGLLTDTLRLALLCTMQRPATRGSTIAIASLLSAVTSACTTPAPAPTLPTSVAAVPESPNRTASKADMPIAKDERPPAAMRRVACEQQNDLRSRSGDRETAVTFNNRRRSAVSIYWLDYQGRPVHYRDLAPSEGYRQPRSIGSCVRHRRTRRALALRKQARRFVTSIPPPSRPYSARPRAVARRVVHEAGSLDGQRLPTHAGSYS